MSLISVLKRCHALSQISQDSLYSSTGVTEIVAILSRAIEGLETGSDLNLEELKLLFAPTGDLQETSMGNGWGDEYLELSSKFDTLIGSHL